MGMHRRSVSVLAGLVGMLLLGGCLSGASETAESGDQADVPSPGNGDSASDYESVRTPEAAADPAAISIPDIDVEGPLTRTGFNDDRTLEVPEFGDISWFEEGTTPGEPGPAGILGHVDSDSSPDVFYRLHELDPGDEIIVDTEEGESLGFTVDRLEQHAKDEFPTEDVWIPSSEPELRLITCGGEFDESEDSYRDNIIAFASLET